MVNFEPHHRRIHNRAKLIHFGLIPLALAIPLLWLYFAYGVCQETESAFMLKACSMLQLVPLLPALVGGGVFGLIIWELVGLGIEVREETQGAKPRPRLIHAVHGYRAVSPRHKRHIFFAAAQVILVTAALALWLYLESRHSTH